jgi:NarL family two-component system response regulator LiaR
MSEEGAMTEIQPIRVLIADDHVLVRAGIRLFIQAYDDLVLVGEADSGEEAIRLCTCTETDVVLMDLMMPGLGGVAATQAIRQQCPQTRVIALTNYQDVDMVQQALRAGATGYLLKNVTADELVGAIRAAKAAPRSPEGQSGLTPRELEVLAWMAHGLSNPEIAERLVLSPVTVKFHVSNILSKLGCASRTEAVVLAVGQGLVPRPSASSSAR